MSQYHTPVLLDESVSALIVNPSGLYIDATFGGGGHTAELLSRLHGKGHVLAFDRDVDALGNRPDDPRLILIHNNFRFVHNYVQYYAAVLGTPAEADGILADLGVSSHQFDTADRGFSFRFDAPLDMRMHTGAGQTAADLVNGLGEEDLERILRMYGEVEGARKMARLIVKARALKPVETTGDLSKALEPCLPKYAEHKVLAKVFQALRIEVNQEMKALEKFLDGAARSLRNGGRLAVITYHSLEDRMVKNFIRTGNVDGEVKKDMYGRTDTPLRAVGRKPVLPQESEIAANTRARSAKLRVAEKI